MKKNINTDIKREKKKRKGNFRDPLATQNLKSSGQQHCDSFEDYVTEGK